VNMTTSTEKKIELLEFKEALLNVFTRLLQSYEKVYDRCRMEAWGTFACAKGNYRFVRRFQRSIRGLDASEFASKAELLERVDKLVSEVAYDSDYPNPTAVKEEVKGLLVSSVGLSPEEIIELGKRYVR